MACEANRIAPNTTEETTADHMIGKIIKFVDGNLRGAVTSVTDYALANSKEKYTFDAVVENVPDNSFFVVM